MKDFIVTRTGRIVHRVRQVKLAVVHQVPTNWKLWTYSPNSGTQTYPTRPRAAQAAYEAQMQVMDWFDAHMARKGAPVSFEHGKNLDHMEALSMDPAPLAETVDCASCGAPAGRKCTRSFLALANGADEFRSPHASRRFSVHPPHRFVELGDKGPHCVVCGESAYAAGDNCIP